MRYWLSLLALLMVFQGFAESKPRPDKWLGDDDPYPLNCINFSGSWVDDEGNHLDLRQEGCAHIWVTMNPANGTPAVRMSMIMDNIDRVVRGNNLRGTIRHRWNTNSFGSYIETDQYLVSSWERYHEHTVWELGDREVLLISGSSVLEDIDTGKIRRETFSNVYRRAAPFAF